MLEFDAEKHEYRVDGRYIPNVTSVTDSLSSYAGVPRDVLERKAELGTAVHYATELYDANDLDFDTLPDVVAPYVNAWIKFIAETGWVTQVSEQRVFSAKYQYAGTLDAIGHFTKLKRLKPRHICVLDKKTTYDYLPSFGPQLAAYQRAWNESNTPRATRRICVRLKPDETYEMYECEDEADWSVYLAALTMKNWKRNNNLEHERYEPRNLAG